MSDEEIRKDRALSWRAQFREDNRLLLEFIRAFYLDKIWLFGAALTFLLQVKNRMDICEGFLPCTFSMVKNAVWSLIWPMYWLVRFTDYKLVYAIFGPPNLP